MRLFEHKERSKVEELPVDGFVNVLSPGVVAKAIFGCEIIYCDRFPPQLLEVVSFGSSIGCFPLKSPTKGISDLECQQVCQDVQYLRFLLDYICGEF